MPDQQTSTPEQCQQLVAEALNVRDNAYAPYSKFLVGAAVLTAGGQIYAGANVENSSYGLTICAERVAATAAIAAGARTLAAVAIATDGGHGPCGACRQFLYEFAESDMEVLLVNSSEPAKLQRLSLNSLLPHGFKLR